MKKFTNENNIYKNDLKTSIYDILHTSTNDNVTLIIGSFYTYNTVIKELNILKSV